LIVDDNRDAAEVLAILLEAEGATVAHVNNGHDALEMMDSFKPDALLLDIGMPGLDG
jgi:CheY-like chemotaxis protein